MKWTQIVNGKKRPHSPGNDPASSEAKSQAEKPGVDGDEPNRNSLWDGWGNSHQKAVNENDESPTNLTLGCFLPQPSNPSKTDEQQETNMLVSVQEEPNESNFQNNPWDPTFSPSSPQPSNQTNATEPQDTSPSLPQNTQTWRFGEPTSNKTEPERRRDGKKQKVHAGASAGTLPLYVGTFDKNSNCFQFDGSSFPNNVSNETGAATLLHPITNNIFGHPNQKALN